MLTMVLGPFLVLFAFGQGIEIGRMVQLLRDFDESEVNEGDTSMEWMGHSVPVGEMPGRNSDCDLGKLVDL